MTSPFSADVDKRDLSQLHASIERYGFGCLPDALHADALQLLQQEALVLKHDAVLADNDNEVTYRARIAPLGANARAFLACGALESLLVRALGGPWVCSDTASCFTYYESGDFLGAHRDRADVCEITVILYLHVERPMRAETGTGLRLNVYAAEDERRVVLVIPTRTGTLVLGRGASVAHERPRLLQGEAVVALTSCFTRR